jgi:eukaryotic-like serine/threonine-protein kinase
MGEPVEAERVLGRYVLEERLAVGGMAEIFRARDATPQSDGRRLVVKRLLPQLAAEPSFVEQFLHEARVSAQLVHPNVVAVLDVGEWEGDWFLALEYVHGLDLHRLLARSLKHGEAIPWPLAVRVLHDAALGLGHAHAATGRDGRPLGLIHRDISLRNVMVSTEGVTKVLDFGIARAADRPGRTRVGTVKGTVGYISPEQLRGEPATPASDQFALGVVAWELLAGRPLFSADTQGEVMRLVLEQRVGPPSDFAPGLPGAVDAAVLRMLQRSPDGRYPGCQAVAEALAEVLRGQPAWWPAADEVGRFVARLLDRAGDTSGPGVARLQDAVTDQPLLSGASRALPEALEASTPGRAGPEQRSDAPFAGDRAAAPPGAPPAPGLGSSWGTAADLAPAVAAGVTESGLAPAGEAKAGASAGPAAGGQANPAGQDELPHVPLELPVLPSAAAAPLASRLEPERQRAPSRSRPVWVSLTLTAAVVAALVGTIALLAPRTRARRPAVAPPAEAAPLAVAEAQAQAQGEPEPDPEPAPAAERPPPPTEPPQGWKVRPPGTTAVPARELALYLFESSPPGAELFIDGHPAGRAPQQVEMNPGSSHLVRFELEGYGSVAQTVWPRAKDSRTVSMLMPPQGMSGPSLAEAVILVKSLPSGAPVEVDGRPVGVTPLSVALSPEKPHVLQASFEGHAPGQALVTLKPGEKGTVTLVRGK